MLIAWDDRLLDLWEATADESKRTRMAWCLQVARKRVEAIVSNQRRGSYDKVAILAAACAEVLQLRGRGQRAQAFVDGLRNAFPKTLRRTGRCCSAM